jgi:ATP-binding cassette subfamily B protein
MFIILLLELLAIPLALLVPVPLKIAVDSAVGAEPLPSVIAWMVPMKYTDSPAAILVTAALLILFIAFLTQAQSVVKWLLQTFVGEKLVMNFRAELLRHSQRLSLAYHDLKGTSDAIYRIQYDASSIQWILINGITPFITASLTVVGMIYVTARIDRTLAIIALTVAPILFLLVHIYRGRLRNQWKEVKILETNALSVVQEVLGSLRVVKAFAQEEREQRRFLTHAYKGIWARIRVVLSESGFGLFVGLTTAAGTAAVLFIGIRHVQSEVLTLGDLIIVMAYLAQLYHPLQTIGKQVASLQGSLASAERALTLLDESPGVSEKPNARSIDRATGSVNFSAVSFGYTTKEMVLHNLSFDIPAGVRVGIAGRTGAGKTTIMSLLTRFYDPSSGTIYLDNTDIREYKLKDLRRQFAIVLQEPVLLSTSIAENIAYARPDATEREIIEAARAANAHEFITGLTEGYNTLVGERGLRLSGGERQRIALARAFLRDAPVLILDEPTSSVDIHTEQIIIEAMDRLMRNRTTFIIAHRLNTLMNCDMLLVINEGKLITVTSEVSTAIKDLYSSDKTDLLDVSQK